MQAVVKLQRSIAPGDGAALATILQQALTHLQVAQPSLPCKCVMLSPDLKAVCDYPSSLLLSEQHTCLCLPACCT